MEAEAYVLESPKTPLVKRTVQLPDPAAGEAIVEVLACGLCHTDLGYADGSVPTKKPLPITLGHEVVGAVVAAGANFGRLTGARVVVPAVLPCGQCAFCKAGRANACPNQKMPGNDIDGGFATHLQVPAAPLVPIPEDFPAQDVAELAVVADAVSTAYQAIQRSQLAEGDLAVVVGAGGVGSFVAQIARAKGARVIALDVRADRLAALAPYGADETLLISEIDGREIRKKVREFAGKGLPTLRYRIFECSGTTGGQTTAYGLLERAATLVQVGYTPNKIELRLSNLMAFDATVHGTWGCPPELYPEVLRLIKEKKVVLKPFIEPGPMSSVNDYLAAMAAHRLERRMVLDPRS